MAAALRQTGKALRMAFVAAFPMPGVAVAGYG
jgi:hypothetical protein